MLLKSKVFCICLIGIAIYSGCVSSPEPTSTIPPTLPLGVVDAGFQVEASLPDASCQLLSCATNQCGLVPDGCTGVLNCGSCSIGETCFNNQCCSSSTDVDFCATLQKVCGVATGVDNCGTLRTVQNCGLCPSTQSCFNGQCCSPESDAEFCAAANGQNCGSLTAFDNCGVERTVNCGTCQVDNPALGPVHTCGPNNTCSCIPRTVCPATACGNIPVGCGDATTLLACPACPTGETCTVNQDLPTAGGKCCTTSDAAFCASLNIACGPASGTDAACGIKRTVVNCGACTAPTICNALGKCQ